MPILGNDREEAAKTFFVVLSNPTVAAVADAQGQGTLTDDDPTLSINDVTVQEGDSGSADAVFTVTLSAACAEAVTVVYETCDGTARASVAQDYQPVAGTLTFDPGQVQKTIAVPILGDFQHEEDEQFSVKLTHPTRANIADNEGTGTISDDDPLISVSDATLAEGASGTSDIVFTVSLSSPPRRTTTVNYRTSDRSAVAGEDYQAQTGTITFQAGDPAEKTIAVPILGDTTEELTENFVVLLSDAQGGTIADSEAQGTIVADDGLLVSVDSLNLVEGDGGLHYWSSFVGGSQVDSAADVAADATGDVWLVGRTASSGWVSGGYDSTYNGGDDDAFVAKISPSGQVLWSTYLGGTLSDYAAAIAVDASGNAWVAGRTKSPDWVWGGFDTSHNGDYDTFLAKISPDGQLLWSSYLGGAGTDYPGGVAVDTTGNVWVTGATASAGWASGGYDTSHNGGYDGFLAKVSAAGQLLWSTYLGATSNDYGNGLAVSDSGNAWVAGHTGSSGWVSGGYDTSYGGGEYDGFVAVVNGNGQAVWSTFLGWDGRDYGFDIAIDPSGNGWVVGQTTSNGWISGGFDNTQNGGNDGYVVKIAPNGQHVWSTYLGRPWEDYANGIAIDADGNGWVSGYGDSSGWLYGGFDSSFNGGAWDAFVAKIAGNGKHLLWGSCLGGTGSDRGGKVAIDASGDAWIVGYTDSSGWVSGGFDTTYNGQTDGFLVKVGDNGITMGQFTVALSQEPGATVTVDYTTADRTGVGGADYLATSGRLTFQPGQPLQQTIPVLLMGDQSAEADEEFLVTLSNPTGAIISIGQGRGTIANDDPLVSIDDVTLVEGQGGTSQAVFTVTLSEARPDTVTLSYATANGTAKAGSDYVAVSGTLTFGPGETQQPIIVQVLGDSADEGSELFYVNLSNAQGGTILDGQGQGTVTDDDPILSVSDLELIEGNGGTTQASFNVRLSAAPLERVTVRYSTADVTAVAGEDYQPASGTLIFQPYGALEQTIVVPVLGDAQDEFDESFRLTLYDATYAVISDATGEATIRDDDPQIFINDLQLVEGDGGTSDAVFAVTLSSEPAHTVTVAYATADGTAAAGEDYVATAGTLTFLAGQTEQTIVVPVLGDTAGEINETFLVRLSNAANAVIADAEGTGTIVGDDGPLVSIDDVALLEGDSGTSYAQFTVSLSGEITQEVRVDYTTASGTATAGVDYNPASGTLIFPAGPASQRTLLVPILGDTSHEGDETFFVYLTGSTVVAISDREGVGTIRCDDPTLAITDASLAEGNSGNPLMQFTVAISQDPVDTVTVNWATANGTATAGSDYLAANGTLSFTPGGAREQIVQVYLISDAINEANETLLVRLSGPVNAEIADGEGVGTIVDDDGPKLSIDDVWIAEGDSGNAQAVFTVRLSQAATATVTVNYATENGTALAGVDYQSTSGTLMFDVGVTEQTVTVPVLGDLVDEPDETFVLKLSNAAGAPIADAEAVGTIGDDDAATLSINDVTVPEGYNGWVNSRTWQGTYWVTPMTGESYHLMRISGAVAADDPWLVSGYDVGRFRFQVKTMGVAAMTLQAVGQEGSIRLTWQQDDFDLLAGYHLYRSTSATGTYQRINSAIIPVGSESYVDTDVTPAVPMYYKFTVVQTDMSESGFSNVASAAALDTIPPVITHAPKTSAPAGFGLRLTARVTDNVDVEGVTAHYRALGSTQAYTSLAMVNVSGDDWTATIPGSAVQPPGLEYYLLATDGISEVYHGTPAAPHSVVVSAAPTLISVSPGEGPTQGGTTVTLAGTLFQAGASVEFGGVPATNVVVQTSNQIICITPPHFPATVDVRVINPDSTEATLLNGFRYVDQDVVLSLPTMSADHGAIVDVPLSASDVDGLRAAGVTVSFNTAVLQVQSVATGTLTSGWSLVTNTATPGQVRISLASATPVSGSGSLAKIQFEVVGAPASQTPLTITSALLNDGAIECQLSNGLFAVNGFFTVSGAVRYFTGSRAVPGTELSMVGVGVHSATSDSGGLYSIGNVLTGAYTLTPRKIDDVYEITAYDASLVLQAAAGLRSLSSNEVLAADVNRNGAVTEMDASYILEKSVGLLPGAFPGAGKLWAFVPAERTYQLLSSDLTAQDFTAILIGDVSGNWTVPGGGRAGARGLAAQGGTGTTTLSMPQVECRFGGQAVLPLTIARAGAEVFAANLVLAYDAQKLALHDVVAGPAASGMSVAVNANQPGVIQLGLAGAQPLAADGTLFQLSFDVIRALGSPTPVSFTTASLNEGAVAAALENGAVAGIPEILDRLLFYNRSYFDGNDAAANAADDGAIAPHTPLLGGHGSHTTGQDEPDKELGKDPLLPGQTATFANYTSYSRGLNGIMLDAAAWTNTAALSAADFRFRVGNSNTPDAWVEPAVAPSVSIRSGAGAGGSDRITLVWPDNTIQKQWLQVTVLATANTGLTQNDVFYFGNAIGESGSGNTATFAFVTVTDELGARNHPHSFLNRAGVKDPYDFNRDSFVSVSDELAARQNGTSFLNALRLITVPSVVATDDRAATDEDTPRAIDVLANDRDVLGHPLSVYRLDAASALGAALALNPNGTVRYDPTGAVALQALNAGEALDDTFTYTLRDARGGTATATVVLVVTGLAEAGGQQAASLVPSLPDDQAPEPIAVAEVVARLDPRWLFGAYLLGEDQGPHRSQPPPSGDEPCTEEPLPVSSAPEPVAAADEALRQILDDLSPLAADPAPPSDFGGPVGISRLSAEVVAECLEAELDSVLNALGP